MFLKLKEIFIVLHFDSTVQLTAQLMGIMTLALAVDTVKEQRSCLLSIISMFQQLRRSKNVAW